MNKNEIYTLNNMHSEVYLDIVGNKRIPKNPKFYYDNHNNAVFERTSKSLIQLNKLSENIVTILKTKNFIVVNEFDKKGNILHCYQSPIFFVMTHKSNKE